MLKAVAAGSGGGSATAVTAAAVLAANQVVVGDDGSRGIKTANANTILNINGGTPPTIATGSVFELIGANAAITRFSADSFGAIGAFSVRRANGTLASPTALANGDQIGAFNAHGFYVSGGPAYAGPAASVQMMAAENWTSTANGTSIILATTPNTTTTLTTALTINSDQSATLVGRLTAGGITNTGNGAASVSNSLWNGTVFTGGTGTTTFPAMFVQPSGTTAATTWSTSGTGLGMNLATGFAGNFLDFHVAGAAGVFSVDSTGIVTTGSNVNSGGRLQASQSSVIQWNGRGILTSPVAGSVQLGAVDNDLNSAIVAQTLRTQGALTGGTTNQAGKDFTFIVSPGKGTGVGGSFIVQTAPAGASSATLNAPATVFTANTTGLVIASGKTFTLGNAATTGLAAGVLAATTNATVVITDSAGQAYRIPCII